MTNEEIPQTHATLTLDPDKPSENDMIISEWISKGWVVDQRMMNEHGFLYIFMLKMDNQIIRALQHISTSLDYINQEIANIEANRGGCGN